MKNKKQSTFKILMLSWWGKEKGMQARLICSLLLVMLSSALVISLPWVMKNIIDLLSMEPNSVILVWILLSYGVLWSFSQVLANLKEIIAYRAFERGINRFGLSVFKALLKAPISLHNQLATGRIMNSIERAQNAMPDIFASLLFVLLPMIIEVVISGCLLTYYYGIYYSGILFIIPIIYVAYTYLTISWLIKAQKRENETSSKVGSYLTDILLNIEGVHYQGMQAEVIGECSKRLTDREDAMTGRLEKSSLVTIGQNIIAGMGLTIITIMLGKGVINNELVLSDFVLFNGYLLQFLLPLSMLGMMFRNVRDGLTKMEDAAMFILSSMSSKSQEDRVILDNQPYSIELKNVSFVYPKETKTVLSDVSFSLPRGESLAIIGKNGSGKTTITKLLYGFYDNYQGQILLGEYDIKNIQQESLRKNIGVVPQDVFILNTTIGF